MIRFLPPVFLLACAPSATDDTSSVPDVEACIEGLAVGDCAPDFTLPNRYSEPFTLSAQRGKVALVDISALW